MALATSEDVALYLGRDLTEAETVIVAKRLDHAEDLLISRVPNLVAKTEDQRYYRLVVMVEIDMVLRLIRNVNGYRREADGDYQYAVDDRVASGRLEILSDELSLLGVKRSIALSMNIGAVMPSRDEGAYNPLRGRSGPETAPFETGIDEGVWS